MNATGSLLHGLRCNAVVHGRKSVNGARYSVEIKGLIGVRDDNATIYDLIHQLADHLKTKNREMELPDSFKITLYRDE